MKLTCSKDLLLQYINIVNKAVSNRTTLPILECILLTANERGFIMTGNDLEIGIRTAPIEAEIQEAGEVAIEARIFNEIVRRLNGESVTIATDEDYAVTIVSGSSEFKIMGQSGEDFPTLPEVEQERLYSMEQNERRAAELAEEVVEDTLLSNPKAGRTGEIIIIKAEEAGPIEG